MQKPLRCVLLLLGIISFVYGYQPAFGEDTFPVTVMPFPGGHKEDGMWSAIHATRDGRVYVGLCSHGGSSRLYVYDPRTDTIRHLAMMQEAVNELTTQTQPHGKLHSQILEDDNGKIWFGTDVSYHFYFARWDDPIPYPGGHMLVYDPKTGVIKDRGIPFPGEAIRTLIMDKERQRLYSVTFPMGKFYVYDMLTGQADFKGRVNNADSIARLIVMDDEGNVYGSYAPYRIFKYDVENDCLLDLPVTIPHLESPWNDRGHFHRENIWRNIIWEPNERVFYGMEHGSATLFRFNPRNNHIEDLGQFAIDALQGKRIVPYTPHAFVLHPNGNIYFAAPGIDRTRPNHMLKYNTITGERSDLGVMKDPQGGYPISMGGAAVDKNGNIYLAGRLQPNGASEKESARIQGFVIIKAADIR